MEKYHNNDNYYPYEAFVQESLEKYFIRLGYELKTKEQVDLIAEKGNELWIIEAKGVTSAVGTDFNTCLGQLVKSMKDKNVIYAIAIPKHIKYKHQCELIPKYYRELVGLHILLEDETGKVNIILPLDTCTAYFEQ